VTGAELARGFDDVAGFRDDAAREEAMPDCFDDVVLFSDEAGADEIAGAAELLVGCDETGGGAALEGTVPPLSDCDEGAGCSELLAC
jgi:F420-0:gamma-glutamyl ligase